MTNPTTPHDGVRARVVVIDAPVTTLAFYRGLRRRGFTRMAANFITVGYAVRDGALVAYGPEDTTVAALTATRAAPGSSAATPTGHHQ